jgi:hypothetical protein
MQEQNEPAYQNEEAQVFYKGRTPSAKLGLKISTALPAPKFTEQTPPSPRFKDI